MEHRFDINSILADIVGYRGVPFPGGVGLQNTQTGVRPAERFYLPEPAPQQGALKSAAPLRACDRLGRWYFMPVYFVTAAGRTIEFPYAVMNIKGGKKIVSTDLAGSGKGSVNELITHNGYTISLAGMILSPDNTYPEDAIAEVRDLVMLDEPLEIVSALTGILLAADDKVIVTSYDFPFTPGLENGQAVKLELRTDAPLELVIE